MIRRSFNTSHRFKKHFKKIKKGGQYDLDSLWNVLDQLEHNHLNKLNYISLPKKYHDHKLVNYHGLHNLRELHIKPDWLLVYQLNHNEIILYDTGSHNNIFK